MNRGIAHLVGCGPGGADWVTPAAHRTVEACDIVMGPGDLQSLFPRARGARLDLPFRPEATAPLVESVLARGLSCAVLVRGDCGLHSLAKGLQARLPTGSCRRVPGLSSIQLACAAFGLDWEKGRVVSAHGRALEGLSEADREAKPLIVLGGGPGFAPILEGLRRELEGAVLHLACDLTLPTERLLTVRPDDPIPTDLPSRTIALFETSQP